MYARFPSGPTEPCPGEANVLSPRISLAVIKRGVLQTAWRVGTPGTVVNDRLALVFIARSKGRKPLANPTALPELKAPLVRHASRDNFGISESSRPRSASSK